LINLIKDFNFDWKFNLNILMNKPKN
jgi:hypothetical protein